jgi:hypothetical protein
MKFNVTAPRVRYQLVKAAMFSTMALGLLAAAPKASAQTIDMYSGDAHKFASALRKTTGTQDRLNSIASVLTRYLPYSWAWGAARSICYTGINDFVAWRVDWCADRSWGVRIYTAWWIPYWADRR